MWSESISDSKSGWTRKTDWTAKTGNANLRYRDKSFHIPSRQIDYLFCVDVNCTLWIFSFDIRALSASSSTGVYSSSDFKGLSCSNSVIVIRLIELSKIQFFVPFFKRLSYSSCNSLWNSFFIMSASISKHISASRDMLKWRSSESSTMSVFLRLLQQLILQRIRVDYSMDESVLLQRFSSTFILTTETCARENEHKVSWIIVHQTIFHTSRRVCSLF